MMKILAIETSCDETAIAVVEGAPDRVRVLSNVVSSQIPVHAAWGGVVPHIASREHAANIEHVFQQAIHDAGVAFPQDIDAIAVTHGPGLGPALIIGITFAKTLAAETGLPLIDVDHMDGHIHSNWLDAEQPMDAVFPVLNLIVSGGHTELVTMRDHGDYTVIGETQDDAVGEAFDKVARMLGLGYPGGPAISKLAQEGNPLAFPFPQPMRDSNSFHFSYSGLKTAVLYALRDMGDTLKESARADVAASFQEAAIEVLVHKTIRAAHATDTKTVLLSGGVSANKLLRERLAQRLAEEGIAHVQPLMKYTTDNAAMIGAAGYFRFMKGNVAPWNTVAMRPNLTLGETTTDTLQSTAHASRTS